MIHTDGTPTIANLPRRHEYDVNVRRDGNLFLLQPVSARAVQWLGDHISDDAQIFGGAYVVEHGYIYDIVDGLLDEGLIVR